jgi:hypothetical protein
LTAEFVHSAARLRKACGRAAGIGVTIAGTLIGKTSQVAQSIGVVPSIGRLECEDGSRWPRRSQLAHKALHRLVRIAEPVFLNQILVDALSA